jgi:hypothetical protein
MTLHTKNPTARGAAGLDKTSSLPGGIDDPPNAPEIATAQSEILRNPHAVREAKRLLKLEFLHECAGGIQIHAALVQTFAEIGDTAGTLYSLKRLFAHAKAAHAVYVDLRQEAGQ